MFYFEKEFVQHNGSNPSWSLWTSINGKVLEYNGLPSGDYTDFEPQKRLYTFLESEMDEHKVYTNKTKIIMSSNSNKP